MTLCQIPVSLEKRIARLGMRVRGFSVLDEKGELAVNFRNLPDLEDSISTFEILRSRDEARTKKRPLPSVPGTVKR